MFSDLHFHHLFKHQVELKMDLLWSGAEATRKHLQTGYDDVFYCYMIKAFK